MSSSVGNNIPLAADADEMFGRTMRISDELAPEWWRLVVEREPPPLEPMASKLALAHAVVKRSHGADAADAAEERFTRVVRRREAPEEVPEVALPAGDPIHLPALLVASFGVRSTSEARRLVEQGGVRLGGAVVHELDLARQRLVGELLQVGKRRFGRLVDRPAA
jgi:tyrosyl-tRNA synthetase